MLQPFILFQTKHIEECLTGKKYYLVAQSYPRGNGLYSATLFTSLLITSYDTKDNAEQHRNTLEGDKYAAVIDLARTDHYRKIISMMTGNKYKIFYAVISEPRILVKYVELHFQQQMKKYLDMHHAELKISSPVKTVALEIRLGEMYISVQGGDGLIGVRFSEIEFW